MTYNDIKWHTMTYNDIQWHTMTYLSYPPKRRGSNPQNNSRHGVKWNAMAIAPFESISWCCDQHLAGWWAEDSAPTRWLSWLDVSAWCWCQGCNNWTINFMVGFWTRRVPNNLSILLAYWYMVLKKNVEVKSTNLAPVKRRLPTCVSEVTEQRTSHIRQTWHHSRVSWSKLMALMARPTAWSYSECPGKTGKPRKSSAQIQPKPQMLIKQSRWRFVMKQLVRRWPWCFMVS